MAKTAKLPNPTDAKSRRRYAGKLHFQSLPAVPDELMELANDAFRYESQKYDISKQWGASANGSPGAQKCLLSIAQLLETMSR